MSRSIISFQFFLWEVTCCFWIADDPARTSSKSAASLCNYNLGRPTPRRPCWKCPNSRANPQELSRRRARKEKSQTSARTAARSCLSSASINCLCTRLISCSSPDRAIKALLAHEQERPPSRGAAALGTFLILAFSTSLLPVPFANGHHKVKFRPLSSRNQSHSIRIEFVDFVAQQGRLF